MQHLSFCDWLIELSIMSLSFTHLSHITGFLSFLKLNNISWYLYTTFSLFRLFLYSVVGIGHILHHQLMNVGVVSTFLAIMNNAAMSQGF